MYRAAYTFKGDDNRALSFQEGDKFTVIDRADDHWLLAQNGFGQVGYIPANYVVKDEVSNKPIFHLLALQIILIACVDRFYNFNLHWHLLVSLYCQMP